MKGIEVKSCENCPYNKPDMDGDICSNCEEAAKQEVVVEIDELKKVLKIIKDKKVNVANFIQWLEAKEDKATYEQYLFDCFQEGWFIHPNDGVVKEFPGLFLQTCEKLTKEEFNLLKGWLTK